MTSGPYDCWIVVSTSCRKTSHCGQRFVIPSFHNNKETQNITSDFKFVLIRRCSWCFLEHDVKFRNSHGTFCLHAEMTSKNWWSPDFTTSITTTRKSRKPSPLLFWTRSRHVAQSWKLWRSVTVDSTWNVLLKTTCPTIWKHWNFSTAGTESIFKKLSDWFSSIFPWFLIHRKEKKIN